MRFYRTNRKWAWEHRRTGPTFNPSIAARTYYHTRRVALFGIGFEWRYGELVFS